MSVGLAPRLLGGIVLSVGVVLAVAPSSALAHVGTDKSEITADASTTLTFSIGHGCEGSATNSMKFQVPESILNAAPQVKPGWTITTESAELAEPAEAGDGEEQTDRVAVITFTADAGSEVDDAFRDSFTLAFRAPAEEGEVFFKLVQGCEESENAWIEEWDGTGEEPEHPAPSVMVVAAAPGEGGDQHAEETAATVAADSDEETAATVLVTEESGDDDGGDSNGVAIAALVVGGLGLATGGTALVRSGRKPSAE